LGSTPIAEPGREKRASSRASSRQTVFANPSLEASIDMSPHPSLPTSTPMRAGTTSTGPGHSLHAEQLKTVWFGSPGFGRCSGEAVIFFMETETHVSTIEHCWGGCWDAGGQGNGWQWELVMGFSSRTAGRQQAERLVLVPGSLTGRSSSS
jgi:hypothetical protein